MRDLLQARAGARTVARAKVQQSAMSTNDEAGRAVLPKMKLKEASELLKRPLRATC